MVVKTVENTIKLVMGIILVILGIIGGLIPVFQGWIFGIPGLLLLSSIFPPLRRWLEKFKKQILHKDT